MLRTITALAFVVVALLGAGTGAALGHAVAVETAPPDGAVLAAAPADVVIVFNEPVAAVSGQVLDAGGRNVAHGMAVEGSRLRIALSAGLPDGRYIASYRVVSADGHPVGGSLAFAVGDGQGPAARRDASPHDAGWRLATIAVQFVLYACLLGSAGAIVFALRVRPPGDAVWWTLRFAAWVAMAGAVAALLAIGIHGGLLAGGTAGDLARPSTWWAGLTSRFGRTAVAAAAGLALAVAALRWQRFYVVGLGMGTALISFVLSGHIVPAGPRLVTAPVLYLHVAAAAFWAGSLAPLHWTVTRYGRAAAPAVRRFSHLAVWAVAALVASGLVIAALQVRSLGGLTGTTYGWTLLAKIGCVGGLLALAGANRLRLLPRLERGDGRPLRLSVGAEIALMLGVLVATAALGTTPPPRVLEPGAVHGHAHHSLLRSATVVHAGGRAVIRLTRGPDGMTSVRVALSGADGAPLAARSVDFTAANPAAGVEPIRRTAEAVGTGAWGARGLALSPRGAWRLGVEVLVSDFEKTTFEAEIDLP